MESCRYELLLEIGRTAMPGWDDPSASHNNLTCSFYLPTFKLMQDDLPPWARWSQNDLPCIFSREQAADNANYLQTMFGTFLHKQHSFPNNIKHPVATLWGSEGIDSFLRLNSLAQDIRILEKVPGFETVISDLLDRSQCMPAWHVLHSAAMLGRPVDAEVIRFFPQTHESDPDYLIRSLGNEIAVEAKCIRPSKKHMDFDVYATDIIGQMMAVTMHSGSVHPEIIIVCKNADSLPDVVSILDALSYVLKIPLAGGGIECRTDGFNIFARSVDPNRYIEYSHFHLLCPRSPSEDIRVECRAKKASKQLSTPSVQGFPGIFVLSVSEYQDPRFICSQLQRRFSSGQYRGISNAMLIHSGTRIDRHIAAPLDLMCLAVNDKSDRIIGDIPYESSGLVGRLMDVWEGRDEVPCYRAAKVHAKVVNTGLECGVAISNIRALTSDMLD